MPDIDLSLLPNQPKEQPQEAKTFEINLGNLPDQPEKKQPGVLGRFARWWERQTGLGQFEAGLRALEMSQEPEMEKIGPEEFIKELGLREQEISRLTAIQPGYVTGVALKTATPFMVGWVAKAPLVALPRIAAFTALDSLFQLENLAPEDAHPDVKSTLELIDFIAKGYMTRMAFAKGKPFAKSIFQKYTKAKMTQYNMPKTVEIPREVVRDIFQTGTKATPEQLAIWKELGLTGKQLRTAVSKGVSVKVPAEKLVTITDKTFWSKIKGAFGVKPSEPKITREFAGEITRGPTGLLKGPIPFKSPLTGKELVPVPPKVTAPPVAKDVPAIVSPITKPVVSEQPLVEQAKKYKTAEEFVVEAEVEIPSMQKEIVELGKNIVEITPEKKEAVANKALEVYGEAKADESIGFILPDGKTIDSSGYNQGNQGPKGERIEGRFVDHREISMEALDALPEKDYAEGYSGGEGLVAFQNITGALRISVFENEVNFDIGNTMPTVQQFKILKKISEGKTVFVDITNEKGDNIASGEFNNIEATKKFILKNKEKLKDRGKIKPETIKEAPPATESKFVKKIIEVTSKEAKKFDKVEDFIESQIPEIAKLTEKEFLGKPTITKLGNASQLKAIGGQTIKNVESEPFKIGEETFSIFRQETGFKNTVIAKGDKVVATYDGETLVVNKGFRKQGIGTALVKDFRTRNPEVKPAKTRTIQTQRLQKRVFQQIQSDLIKQKQQLTDIWQQAQEKPETKVRGLAKGVEEKAISHKLTDTLGDLPEYKTISMEDQANKAQKLLKKDYEKAKRIAMGEEVPPADLLPESAFVAVENKAIKEGDVNTLRDLATSSSLTEEATVMGQRIRTLGERDPESPVKAINEVVKARDVKAQKKLKVKNVKKAKQKEMKKIKSEIKKVSSTAKDWIKFVESLEC